jgi:predicted ATP-grasp superfamily ATP-dependent carboligase
MSHPKLKLRTDFNRLLQDSRKADRLAVVIGLEQITGLNTVRSLHQKGVPIIAITGSPQSALCRTNRCQKVYCENVNDAQLIDTLQSLGKHANKKPLLIPTSDTQVELISRHREVLQRDFLFRLPSKKVVDLLLDKTQFASFAQKYSYEVPKTFIINQVADLLSHIENIKFPCIVKPFERTHAWDRLYPNDKVLKIGDQVKLNNVISQILKTVKRLIIQEWVTGDDSDVYFCLTYFDERSQPRASFVGRKIRQWLPEVGSTASAEACFNPIVFKESIRLLKAVGFKGLGSVEFKFDRRDHKFKIMEPTVGRPNLQSFISVANGINLPYIYYSDISGGPISDIHNYNHHRGVKWINEWAEFESARYYMREGRLGFRDWLKSLSGKVKFGLFSISDPLPFFFSLIEKIKGKFKKTL